MDTFLKMMNISWADEIDNIEVEHIITPFIQNDEDALINRVMKGNGGKPIFSQLESIKMAGYSDDPQSSLDQIQKEEAEAAKTNIGNVFNESTM